MKRRDFVQYAAATVMVAPSATLAGCGGSNGPVSNMDDPAVPVSWIELSGGRRLMRDDEASVGGAQLSVIYASSSGIVVKRDRCQCVTTLALVPALQSHGVN